MRRRILVSAVRRKGRQNLADVALAPGQEIPLQNGRQLDDLFCW